MAERNPSRALHFSEGKSGVDQIPPEVLFALGDVYTYGSSKYARGNWMKGNAWHEFYGSALRHLLKFWEGEGTDPESRLPHLSHALWNVSALYWFWRHGVGEDDRPTLTPTQQLEKMPWTPLYDFGDPDRNCV